MTVQFDHRLIAYTVAIVAALHAWQSRSPGSLAVLIAVLGQIALGIWTLLEQVPLGLGLAHQAGAMIVFASAVWAMHEALNRAPARTLALNHEIA